jgi:hypothetical protein
MGNKENLLGFAAICNGFSIACAIVLGDSGECGVSWTFVLGSIVASGVFGLIALGNISVRSAFSPSAPAGPPLPPPLFAEKLTILPCPKFHLFRAIQQPILHLFYLLWAGPSLLSHL